MIQSIRDLYGFTLSATDGEIGSVEEFFFDDEKWAIRYMVVDTGGWLTGQRVLISPIAIQTVHWAERKIDVALTREQVEHSPDVEKDRPVTRQYEVSYLNYYGYPSYWEGSNLWGPAMNPAALTPVFSPMPIAPPQLVPTTHAADETIDPHLQSTRDVRDYSIATTDGEIGHVIDFLVDDETWALRYLVVDTHNWLPGKHVLIAPAWIKKVSWAEGQVCVDLSREVIKHAPAYTHDQPLSREYETELYTYYHRPPYWA